MKCYQNCLLYADIQKLQKSIKIRRMKSPKLNWPPMTKKENRQNVTLTSSVIFFVFSLLAEVSFCLFSSLSFSLFVYLKIRHQNFVFRFLKIKKIGKFWSVVLVFQRKTTIWLSFIDEIQFIHLPNYLLKFALYFYFRLKNQLKICQKHGKQGKILYF